MKGQQKRMSPPHIYFLAILFLYNYTFVLNVTFFFIDIVKSYFYNINKDIVCRYCFLLILFFITL